MKQISLFVLGALASIALMGIVFYFAQAPGSKKSIFSEIMGIRIRGAETLLRLREADARIEPVDVLSLGSSHSFSGLDPRLFAADGLELIHIGNVSQTVVNSYWLLHTYIEKLKPRIVMIEIFPALLRIRGTESTLNLLAYQPRWNRELLSMVAAQKAIQVYRYALFQAIERALHPVSDLTYESLSFRGEYVGGGYFSIQKTTDPARTRKFWSERGRSKNFRVDPSISRYFDRIIELCNEHDTKLFFYVAPVPDEHRISMNTYGEAMRELRGRARAAGHELVDYNLREPMNTAHHFRDPHHLNQMGVEWFHPYVMRDVQKLIGANLPSESSPQEENRHTFEASRLPAWKFRDSPSGAGQGKRDTRKKRRRRQREAGASPVGDKP